MVSLSLLLSQSNSRPARLLPLSGLARATMAVGERAPPRPLPSVLAQTNGGSTSPSGFGGEISLLLLLLRLSWLVAMQLCFVVARGCGGLARRVRPSQGRPARSIVRPSCGARAAHSTQADPMQASSSSMRSPPSAALSLPLPPPPPPTLVRALGRRKRLGFRRALASFICSRFNPLVGGRSGSQHRRRYLQNWQPPLTHLS